MKNYYSLLSISILFIALFIFSGCQPPAGNSTDNAVNTQSENASTAPTIEVSPAEDDENGYKILTADKFKISVNADGEPRQIDVFYQPVTASDRSIKLKTFSSPNGDNNSFETEMQTPHDFNAEIWAVVQYADGQKKETKRIPVIAGSEAENSQNQQPRANSNTNSEANKSVDDNESARSDKKTGGKIQQAELQVGKGNIRLTVNVPAFLLTVWQGDKQIKTYYVGVGRKEYPIPAGMRKAEKIILNPDWIPPDSEWVRESSSVEAGERIPASSSENPLGKIKIPLGNAYLLHEAESENDIGNLVSHGCVRVLRNDIFDLTKLIVQAENLSTSIDEINAAKNDSERRVIGLNNEMPVDINYDTMVVENGVLTIYPDVYDKKTNTVEELRAELESYKIDVSKIDDSDLKNVLEKVDKDHKFVISLDELRAGKTFDKGKVQPLTPYQKG